MITKKHRGILTLAGAILLVAGFAGCKDMFKDPLADKDTGEKITVLLMDRNFIKTKIVVRLVDMDTQEAIDKELVDVFFDGADASNLINFTGKKMVEYQTSTGFIEVGYDPNIVLSQADPQEITVIAMSDNYVSAPQVVSFTEDGVKNVTISMISLGSFKSGSSSVHGEPYSIAFRGVMNSPDLRFIGDIHSLRTNTAYEYMNLYYTLVPGSVACTNLTDTDLYADYGAYFASRTRRPMVSYMPPKTPSRLLQVETRDYVYTSILRTGKAKCERGLDIHVERGDDQTGGTATFQYLLTFSDGTTKPGSITCSFPSTSKIEPIYYPGGNTAVKVELFGDSQYTVSAAVNLANACGGEALFTVLPKSNLQTVQFKVQYTCPNNQIGIALSIGGEFRKAGTTNAWTSFEFFEGVCQLQMEVGADYDLRFNIDGKYYMYTIPTDPSKVQDYMNNQTSTDYVIKSLSIVNNPIGMVLTSEIQFSQGVCDVIQ